MEIHHSASLASIPSVAGFSEPISEAEEIESVKHLQLEGDASFRISDYPRAAQCYGEALEIDADNALLLARRSVANIEQEEYIEAKKDAQYLIKLNPHVAQGHYLLAVSLENLKSYSAAITAYLSALLYDFDHRSQLADNVAIVTAKACGLPEENHLKYEGLSPAVKLIEVGTLLKQANQNTACMEVIQNALELRTLPDHCQQRALFLLASALAANGDLTSAADFYKQSLSVALKLDDSRGELDVYCVLADMYLSGNDIEQAVVYYEKLLSICRDVDPGDLNLRRVVHETLCGAYHTVGELPRALEHANRNLEGLATGLNRGVTSHQELLGKAHVTVGSLYEAIEDYMLSLEHYKKYLSISKASKDRAAVGRAYGCLGQVYHKLCNYPIAKSYYEQQLKISRKLSYHAMQARALKSLADVHVDLKDTASAVEGLQSYLQVSRRLDEFETECLAFISLGDVHKNDGKPQQARYFYEEALKLAERSNETQLAHVSRCKLARVLLVSKEEKDLHTALRLAEDTVAYCMDTAKDGQNAGEDSSSLLEGSYEIAQVALHKLARPLEALEYAETQMRREFLNTFQMCKMEGSPDVGLEGKATVTDMVKTATKQSRAIVILSLCDSYIFRWILTPNGDCLTCTEDESGSCLKLVEDCLLKLRTSQGRLGEAYQTEYRALPLEDSKTNQVRKYHLSKGHSTSRSADNPEQTSRQTIDGEPPLRQLYRVLLSSTATRLSDCDSVVIVANQILSQVPFGSLEDPDGHFLGDKYNVTVVPCIEALKTILRNDTPPEGNILTAAKADDSQTTPTHPIYLDRMLRVVVPPKQRPHSVKRDKGLETPKMSRNVSNPSFVSFDRNSYDVTRDLDCNGNRSEARFIRDHEVIGGTLISKLWSRRDLPSATSGTVQEYRQECSQERALVVGNPKLPGKLRLHGKIWQPLSELSVAQTEVQKVACYLNTEAMIGSKVTKMAVLTELPKATLIHLAMYGSWLNACLACTPNRTSQPLHDGSYNTNAYMIGVDDIGGLRLKAKLVLLSCCYGNRHRSVNLKLPLTFLSAGAKAVLLLLWPVPDVVLEMFLYQFYLTLQEGSLVSKAVAEAQRNIRQHQRFSKPTYWSGFCLLGNDPYINLLQIKRGMLDQLLNTAEADYLSLQKQEMLNVRSDRSTVDSAETVLEKLRQHLSGLLRHHAQHPDVISQVTRLLSDCVQLQDPSSANYPSWLVPLPPPILTSPSAIPLLNQLGFHFQPGSGSSTRHRPQVVFPQWDPDAVLKPVLQALTGLQDVCDDNECAHSLSQVLGSHNHLISDVIDVLSLTKHVPEAQLRVNDAGVRSVWGQHHTRALLASLGFAQVGQLLMFVGSTENKAKLSSALHILCSVSGDKGHAMVHGLDPRHLAVKSPNRPLTASRTPTVKSTLRSASILRTPTPSLLPRSHSPGAAVRVQTAPSVVDERSSRVRSLPSLNPVKLSKSKMAFTTPWWSEPVKQPETREKIRLARSLTDINLRYTNNVKRTVDWHVKSIAPQAQKSLIAQSIKPRRPRVVKVNAGATPSCVRVPVNQTVELSINAVEQRRDYGQYLLAARVGDVQRRHSSEVRGLFEPYVH